jgi:hypothetical protein
MEVFMELWAAKWTSFTSDLAALDSTQRRPCADRPWLARCRAERLACGAAQAFMLGSKNWSLAPRLDAARWRWNSSWVNA